MFLTGIISVLCISCVYAYNYENLPNGQGGLGAAIDVLAADVVSLEKSVDQMETLEHKDGLKLRVLYKNVYDAEGSGCPNSWFHLQCSDSRQCLPQYLVCDGIRHCPNGQDEQECDIEDYVTVGEIFEATLLMNDCDEWPMRNTVARVDSIDKDDLLPNLPKYTWTYISRNTDSEIIANIKDQENWLPAASCGYNDWAGLDQIRKFDLVDQNYITQRAYRMGTGEVCMEWILKRRTSDEPFPWYGYFH